MTVAAVVLLASTRAFMRSFISSVTLNGWVDYEARIGVIVRLATNIPIRATAANNLEIISFTIGNKASSFRVF